MRRMPAFERYLKQFHAPGTVFTYTRYVEKFLLANPQAYRYTHKDIIDYLFEQQQECKRQNKKYEANRLYAIKRYYDHLIEAGRRNDHPCRNIYIKTLKHHKGVMFQNLFSSQELQQLMEKEERYSTLKLRNQVIISLLIYQALTRQEIGQLKIGHIDFDKGLLFVAGNGITCRRHLPFHPSQYDLFERYLSQSRPEIVKVNPSIDSDAFVLSKVATPIHKQDVTLLVKHFMPLFPGRNITPQLIRQSVIANWLNERKLPLEQVQLFAGHHQISITAKYRQEPIEEQREQLNRFFPLG